MASTAKPPPPHPFRIVSRKKSAWYRVHPFDPGTGKFAPDAFNDSGKGNARFSPIFDPSSGTSIPTLYAANSERGAIAEIVLHDVPTPSTGYLHDLERDLSSTLHLSRVSLPDLKLVNLTTTGMKAAGLGVEDLFADDKWDYPRTREWALWIWANMPEADGLFWMSRRDNRSEVVMLFGDRVGDAVVDDKDSQPIAHHEDKILELLSEMGADVIPNI